MAIRPLPLLSVSHGLISTIIPVAFVVDNPQVIRPNSLLDFACRILKFIPATVLVHLPNDYAFTILLFLLSAIMGSVIGGFAIASSVRALDKTGLAMSIAGVVLSITPYLTLIVLTRILQSMGIDLSD